MLSVTESVYAKDKLFSLSNRDKNYLKKIGYLEEDMKQIEESGRDCTIEKRVYKKDGRIKAIIGLTIDETIKIVGKRRFLSALGRACFHWSASVDFSHYPKTYAISIDNNHYFRS